MALYPKVQERIQQELDSLVHNDHDEQSRYLSLRDVERLKYLPLVMKEVLRFACVGPLGQSSFLLCSAKALHHSFPMLQFCIALPHKVSEDDIYDEYLLPKGSTVLANVWYVNHIVQPSPPPAWRCGSVNAMLTPVAPCHRLQVCHARSRNIPRPFHV